MQQVGGTALVSTKKWNTCFLYSHFLTDKFKWQSTDTLSLQVHTDHTGTVLKLLTLHDVYFLHLSVLCVIHVVGEQSRTCYRHLKVVLMNVWKWLRLTFSFSELSLNESKTNDSQLRKIHRFTHSLCLPGASSQLWCFCFSLTSFMWFWSYYTV